VLRTGARWLSALPTGPRAVSIALALALASVAPLSALGLAPDALGRALAQATLGRASAEVWLAALVMGALVLATARHATVDPEPGL
jgi:hypothetical protein